MITISLCLIVKNEEKLLRRCLDSYKAISDEIIIVDTGSTDNTKSIAQEYTDKIYDFEWIDDFAAARNYLFDKAACDYIFCADADEVLDDENRRLFLQMKENFITDIDIVQMYYVNSNEENTVYNFKEELRPKLFKRLRSFTWISPIHETVRLEPVVYDSDIRILHLPLGDHSKRDFEIFVKTINRGIRLENYVLIMFCKELFISGTDEDFLAVADIFTDILSREERNDECRKYISCVLARIYRLKNDYNNFFKICLKDMAIKPCAEICVELGYYFYSLEDYEESVLWFINAATETPSIITFHSSTDQPRMMLSRIYEKLARQFKDNGDKESFSEYMKISRNYLEDAAKAYDEHMNI